MDLKHVPLQRRPHLQRLEGVELRKRGPQPGDKANAFLDLGLEREDPVVLNREPDGDANLSAGVG